MSYMSAKYGFSKRYTNRCVRVTSLQILDEEQIPEDISRVLVDTNQRLLSNLMRGNCPLLENLLFPTHLAEQLGLWRQTMFLPQRKQQKATKLLSQKYFHLNMSQAESTSSHSSFAIVIPGKLF